MKFTTRLRLGSSFHFRFRPALPFHSCPYKDSSNLWDKRDKHAGIFRHKLQRAIEAEERAHLNIYAVRIRSNVPSLFLFFNIPLDFGVGELA